MQIWKQDMLMMPEWSIVKNSAFLFKGGIEINCDNIWLNQNYKIWYWSIDEFIINNLFILFTFWIYSTKMNSYRRIWISNFEMIIVQKVDHLRDISIPLLKSIKWALFENLSFKKCHIWEIYKFLFALFEKRCSQKVLRGISKRTWQWMCKLMIVHKLWDRCWKSKIRLICFICQSVWEIESFSEYSKKCSEFIFKNWMSFKKRTFHLFFVFFCFCEFSRSRSIFQWKK